VRFTLYEPAKTDTLDPSANQKATCQDGFVGGCHLSLQSFSARLLAQASSSDRQPIPAAGIARKTGNLTKSFFEKSAAPSAPPARKVSAHFQSESSAFEIQAVNTIYSIQLYALDR
jgi:hypothetical protein